MPTWTQILGNCLDLKAFCVVKSLLLSLVYLLYHKIFFILFCQAKSPRKIMAKVVGPSFSRAEKKKKLCCCVSSLLMNYKLKCSVLHEKIEHSGE